MRTACHRAGAAKTSATLRNARAILGSDGAVTNRRWARPQWSRENPEYQAYGLPDTSNASDNVVGNASLASYVAVTSQLDDGALMAAKQIVVNL